MAAKTVTSTLFLLVLTGHVVPFTQSSCLTSLRNIVLKDHVISSLSTSLIDECWQACKNDVRCQSLNFFLKQQLCEINNRTIELAPKDVTQVLYTSYFDNPYKAAVGTTKVLPAVSCAEILKTVGDVSGRYWIIDHARSSLPFIAYCNMTSLAIEECTVGQCKNGGKCAYFGFGNYKCTCLELTSGQDCEIKLSVCLSLPCQNGGTCVDQGAAYKCNCLFRFYGDNCDKRCTTTPPLGMQSGSIPNTRITASSIYDSIHDAWQARLHRHFAGRIGAWSARVNSIGQWIQVDLGKVNVVTRVATQGRADTDQWVTGYILQYKSDTSNLINYQGGKVLAGNRDRTSVVTHDLNPAMTARLVRMIVQSWHAHISLRMEIYGCN